MLYNVLLCCNSSLLTNIPSHTMALKWQWKDVVPFMFCGSLPHSSRKFKIFLGITIIYKYYTQYSFKTKRTNSGSKQIKPAVHQNVKYGKQKKHFHYFTVILFCHGDTDQQA